MRSRAAQSSSRPSTETRVVLEGDEDERFRLARELNAKVLRLNLLLKPSFDREDRQVYTRKLKNKMLESK